MTTSRGIPILTYHSVTDHPVDALRRWNVTPAHFRDHIAYLTDAGYTSFTIAEYARLLQSAEPTLPERAVVITFDDGFADFRDSALPILLDHGVAATLFVSTAYVGRTSGWLGPDNLSAFLGWDDLVAIDRAGVEIGSHSHRHVALDELARAEARQEIERSRELLTAHLGHTVTSFAYPFGYHDAAVKQLVAAADFLDACAVKNTLSGVGDDRFAIGRILVEDDPDVDGLRQVITSAPSMRLHERPATRVWRQVRRTRSRLRPAAADDRITA